MDVFSGLDGKLPDGPDACLLLILGRFDVELAARQSAPLCPRQLLAEAQRLGFQSPLIVIRLYAQLFNLRNLTLFFHIYVEITLQHVHVPLYGKRQ